MQQESDLPTSSKPPAFPIALVLRWLLGIYLIVGSISVAISIYSNWQSVHYMTEVDPTFSFYPMAIGWLFKLASGVLLLARSKWLLVAIPGWVLVFLVDFFSRNKFDQLPPEFFSAVVVQLAIFSFAIWLHGRGHLR